MSQKNFVRYAWAVLAYNVGVILWGAYVRATGSGAGCGSHWPLCNGEIIPRAEQVETLIEFAHRATSGIALLLVLVLLVWAFRAFPKSHPARVGAGLSTLFILTEALIGAGLVLFELVAQNASAARAISISVHLANTFLLLALLTLTARWAATGRALPLRDQGAALWLLAIGLVGTIVLGMSGALAALGDTLFPPSSLAQGFEQDLSPAAHFLVQLRLLHPILAVAVSVYWIAASGVVTFLRPHGRVRRFGRQVTLLLLAQLGLGLLNVTFLAPIWLQIVHLLMTDLIWISLILFTETALESHEDAAAPIRLRSAASKSEMSP